MTSKLWESILEFLNRLIVERKEDLGIHYGKTLDDQKRFPRIKGGT